MDPYKILEINYDAKLEDELRFSSTLFHDVVLGRRSHGFFVENGRKILDTLERWCVYSVRQPTIYCVLCCRLSKIMWFCLGFCYLLPHR